MDAFQRPEAFTLYLPFSPAPSPRLIGLAHFFFSSIKSPYIALLWHNFLNVREEFSDSLKKPLSKVLTLQHKLGVAGVGSGFEPWARQSLAVWAQASNSGFLCLSFLSCGLGLWEQRELIHVKGLGESDLVSSQQMLNIFVTAAKYFCLQSIYYLL